MKLKIECNFFVEYVDSLNGEKIDLQFTEIDRLVLREFLGVREDKSKQSIAAIKYLRMRFPLGLKTAKDIADELTNNFYFLTSAIEK